MVRFVQIKGRYDLEVASSEVAPSEVFPDTEVMSDLLNKLPSTVPCNNLIGEEKYVP